MSLRPAGAGFEGHVAPAPIQAKGWDIVKKMLAFAVILAMLGFSIGCGKSTTKRTSAPTKPSTTTGKFTFEAPDAVEVTQGDKTEATVKIKRDAFKDKVALTADVPEAAKGLTASFETSDLEGEKSSSKLTVSAAKDAKEGSYDITIKGKSGSKEESTKLKVTVKKQGGSEEEKKEKKPKKKGGED
jgi:hypothetical protein